MHGVLLFVINIWWIWVDKNKYELRVWTENMRREYETTFLSLTSLLGAVEGRFFGANPGNVRTSLGQYLNYKKEVIENIKY